MDLLEAHVVRLAAGEAPLPAAERLKSFETELLQGLLRKLQGQMEAENVSKKVDLKSPKSVSKWRGPRREHHAVGREPRRLPGAARRGLPGRRDALGAPPRPARSSQGVRCPVAHGPWALPPWSVSAMARRRVPLALPALLLCHAVAFVGPRLTRGLSEGLRAVKEVSEAKLDAAARRRGS